MLSSDWTTRILVVVTVLSIILASVSSYRIASHISHISSLRNEASAVAERNEMTALRLEGVLPKAAAATRKAQEKLARRAAQLEAGAKTTFQQISQLVEASKKRKAKAAESKQQQQENVPTSSHEAASSEPLVFGQDGSHQLEGSQNLMSLEQKWGYDPSSGELQLHRQILGQAAVAARTLEAQCALAAWREYLDNFIAWMDARKDTMLYNWI